MVQEDRPDWKLYTAWAELKRRCNSPSRYANQKEITYDPTWEQYVNFYADMAPSWSPGKILDREDNEGNYNKENCRRASATQSNRNKGNVKLNLQTAEEIRQLYKTGKYTQKQLGKMFNVANQTINYIVNYRLWV